MQWNSYVWFRQLENNFQLRGIPKQKIMLQHASSVLLTDVAAEVIDIIDNDQKTAPTTLKRAVISRLSDSQGKYVQQLFLQVELGDRTPSQLLRHMRSLLDETRVVETPTSNRVTTQQSKVQTKLLEKLELLVPNIPSQFGDKQRPRFSKQSDRPPKYRNQICFYHRMYGDDAKKCQPSCKYPKTDTIISQGNVTGSNSSAIPLQPTSLVLQATNNHLFNPHTALYAIWAPINQDLNMAESLNLNCKQPSKTINSAMVFDTELFQTDIRELLERADDSYLVKDDIHDFLPEHAAASRKTRDKRKRKTPKSTAVNQ
ncbi:unnamed protein product [Hymenolepis diminuta]|uniref:DUF7041 domain-containing protein n=1 Tax=Hymenolepis diminuta TaxID=6216 RepID=A0A564XXB3_HYMDI|nr:unnamed protein product [Hymenolepis diminuta]